MEVQKERVDKAVKTQIHESSNTRGRRRNQAKTSYLYAAKGFNTNGG